MENIEFEFMAEKRRGPFGLNLPKYSRLPSPLIRIQRLKREVRRLDPVSREIFTSWIFWYDSTACERQLRREERFRKSPRIVEGVVC